MNAGSLEFSDDSFDSVVSVMCFHEVRSDPGAAVPGPLAALIEGLRVLRPGGAFVLIDRFGSKRDYGDAARLHAILDSVADWRREPLVATLKAPWPLSTARSLGAVEILAGVRKADPLSNSVAADDSRR